MLLRLWGFITIPGSKNPDHIRNNADIFDFTLTEEEMGYTFFDTAECYIGENADGSISYNEELVGKALAPYRGKVKIVTKFGVKHENRQLVMDSRPETIRTSIEGSLKRLCMDHVDLYYRHRIDPNGILVTTGGAETAVTAKRDILELAAFGTAVHGTTIGRVATVDHLIHVFNDGIAWMEDI